MAGDYMNVFEMDPLVEAVITAMFEQTKWEATIRRLNTSNFTLVHSDLQPW